MAAYQKFHQFNEDLAHKVHDLETDAIIVLLTNVAPTAANAVAADITQIAYTFASDRVVTVVSSGQTAGVYELVLADKTITATGGDLPAFRYAVLANNTAPGVPLIGWYDRGASVTLLENDSLVLDFAAEAIALS